MAILSILSNNFLVLIVCWSNMFKQQDNICVILLLSCVDCRAYDYTYTFVVYNLFQFVFQNGFCVNNKHYNMTILYRSEYY